VVAGHFFLKVNDRAEHDYFLLGLFFCFSLENGEQFGAIGRSCFLL
jgi:MFS-type transporter involved in bile tolerance (Atg22 family)